MTENNYINKTRWYSQCTGINVDASTWHNNSLKYLSDFFLTLTLKVNPLTLKT